MTDEAKLIAAATPGLLLLFAAVFLFSTWRHRLPHIYKPRPLYIADLKTSTLPDGFLSWIPALIRIPEREVFETAGLDALVFLRLFKLSIEIFGIYTIAAAIILFPTYASGDLGVAGFDTISMSHVDQSSSLMWPAVPVAYAFAFISYILFHRNFRRVLAYATEFNTRPRPSRYAVLVSNIPKDKRSDEELEAYFRHIYPDSFNSSMLVRYWKEVGKDYDELNKTKTKLARAEYKWERALLKKPNPTRPTHWQVPDDSETKRKIFQPLARCYPGAHQVDSIEYYQKRVEELKHKIEEERQKTFEPGPSGFVTFSSLVAATVATQTRHSNHANRWHITLAPEPRDVYWRNLVMDDRAKLVAWYIGAFLAGALTIWWTVPVSFVASIANLQYLAGVLPFLDPIAESNPAVKGVLEGLLPPLGLLILLLLLEKLLTAIVKASGVISYSEIDRGVMRLYCFFQIVQTFLVVALSGALFSTLSEIVDNPASAFTLLGAALPRAATFFITFVVTKALIEFSMELLRPGPLLVGNAKAKIAKSEKDKKQAYHPGAPKYGKIYPRQLVIFVIVMSYSIIAPLLLPFGVLYFCIGYTVWKHQLMFVYVPRYESGGRAWPDVFSFMCFALLLSQIALVGTLALKYGYQQIIVLVPLLILTVMFMRFYRSKYGAFLASGALALEIAVDTDNKRKDAAPTELQSVLQKLHSAYKPDSMIKSLDDKDGDEESQVQDNKALQENDNDGVGRGPLDRKQLEA